MQFNFSFYLDLSDHIRCFFRRSCRSQTWKTSNFHEQLHESCIRDFIGTNQSNSNCNRVHIKIKTWLTKVSHLVPKELCLIKPGTIACLHYSFHHIWQIDTEKRTTSLIVGVQMWSRAFFPYKDNLK